ncbi:hypothetical protein Tco_0977155 [Tanacetum coccineum]|uniref:Uncharacterized protein n=1 Tax=Tanacetum coccineum TaxID=301880 RepID=A0ABQ5EJB5_9ASTR
MLQRIFMNEICRMFMQFLLKYIFDFAVSALDSGTTVMMFGASVMIVGVGIGVVVCCTDEMIGVTKGEGTTVKTGVSAIISGIGGRLVLSGITDGDWV